MKFIFVIFISFLTIQCSGAQSDLCETLGSWVEYEISSECEMQLEIMCKNISLLWRMFDASSKWPTSGMSYSSNRDLGNFDECIDINYEGNEGNVKGKYCGLSVAIINFFLTNPIPNPYKLDIKTKPKALSQLPKVNDTDISDRKRSFKDITDTISISTLSLCVPDKCTPREVGLFFVWGMFSEQSPPLVNFVNALPCMTKDSNTTFKWGDILFTTFLAIIGFVIVASTTYDFIIQKKDKKPHHSLLLAFSCLTNGKKLLHISPRNPDQIQCLNGLRFISMMWVIHGHNFVAIEEAPIVNYAEIKGFMDNPKAIYVGAAPIAVDTFFFLSGFLLTFGYLKASIKLSPESQVKRIPMMIIHRYLRLTPALAVLYFASITIFRMLGTGPMWGAVHTLLREQCERHWWSFFLYVQNYVNYNDMCLNHSWYLSADMQMFILAPLVLIPITELIKRDKANHAIIGLLVLIVISVVAPIGSRFADFTIDNTYDSHSRFNDYLIGVLLGIIMRDPRFKKFPFGKITNLIIWCFIFNICFAFIIYYHNIVRVYEHTSDTLFYGLYRPVWCFSLLYMVYSCYHGFGGPVNWILSLPAFQIGGRLSYCMYLLHAVVEMYYVGLIRTNYYFGDYLLFYLFCGHLIVTMILSVVWTLAFESPMIVIEKFIFGGGGTAKPQKKQEST